jgi:hypothetical protein
MAATEPKPRRRLCTPTERAAALAFLRPGGGRIPAADWPGSLERLDQPGLYSWWADAAGAHDLGKALEVEFPPGRIYAGLTGATKWPSGKVGKMSLRQRIGGSHLAGTIYGSTFRQTLAAILRQPLQLQLAAPGRLERNSELELSAWMRQHLQIAVYPFADRDVLANLEHEVLAALDPPLNLDGMPSTPLRVRIRALRVELGRRSAAR